jgi:hypothetical protein
MAIAAMMAMIATTISTSTSVNPCDVRLILCSLPRSGAPAQRRAARQESNSHTRQGIARHGLWAAHRRATA